MSWKNYAKIAAVTILLITSCLPGFARTEISDRTVFELQSLGIVEGDGRGTCIWTSCLPGPNLPL